MRLPSFYTGTIGYRNDNACPSASEGDREKLRFRISSLNGVRSPQAASHNDLFKFPLEVNMPFVRPVARRSPAPRKRLADLTHWRQLTRHKTVATEIRLKNTFATDISQHISTTCRTIFGKKNKILQYSVTSIFQALPVHANNVVKTVTRPKLTLKAICGAECHTSVRHIDKPSLYYQKFRSGSLHALIALMLIS